MSSAYDRASIGEMAAAFRQGLTTPADLLEERLARIAAADDRLHSLSHVDIAGARRAAERASADFARGIDHGPLQGIPIVIKDAIAVKGLPWTAGMPARRARIAQADATCVRRLRRRGAIILAKTAMTEAGFLDYGLHRPPLNPWNPARWPGASSSGSAVAVAAGFAPAALGADTGGSIRFPAAACGLVGLKPTRRAVDLHGVDPSFGHLDSVGPLTRTAADARLVLEAIGTARAQGSVRMPDRLRVGCLRPTPGADRFLAATGAEMVGIALPEATPALEAAVLLFAADSAAKWTPADDWELLGPAVRGQIELGRSLGEAQLRDAHRTCRRFTAALLSAMRSVDLLLSPTLPTPVPEIDAKGAVVGIDLFDFLGISLPVNIAGLPAISLPAGRDANGMPQAIQLMGSPWSDPLLLTLGEAYQAVAGDHGRPALPSSA